MPNFFRTFCFHLGIVCFCNPMTCSGISRERPNLFSPHFQALFKTLFWCQLRRQTDKLIAPYVQNYVHQFLFFFVRNSFESMIKRPSRAGSTLQCDRRGPVAIKILHQLCSASTPFEIRFRSSSALCRFKFAVMKLPPAIKTSQQLETMNICHG